MKKIVDRIYITIMVTFELLMAGVCVIRFIN
jgi:hypothetical protein